MSNIYLINSDTFIGYEDISVNVKEQRILTFVKKMQELDLKMFLGHPLYFDFIQYFTSDTGKVNILSSATTAQDGTFLNQPIITANGKGTGAKASFTVLDGVITSASLSDCGNGYALGASFSVASLPNAKFAIQSLNDLTSDIDTPAQYLNLLNGYSYIDNRGHRILYEGLIPTMVYWTFARFIEADAVRYTASGPVTKDHDNGKALSVSDIVKLVQQQRSVGNAHANEVEKFLYDQRPNGQFPLWRADEKNASSRQAGPRIRSVDRTGFNYPSGGAGYGGYNGDYFDIGGLI